MSTARKIIGLLIIIFVALPILVGVIWTVGVTQAAVSPELISDLPREIISEVPFIIDEVFQEGQDSSVISDRKTRAWFEAASKVEMKPKELLSRTGITDWMEGELSRALGDIGEILRGQREPDPVVFDMRPLKTALRSEEIDLYILKVLDNLPPCDEEGLKDWADMEDRNLSDLSLPPCQPDPELARAVIQGERLRMLEEMEDEIEIFEGVRFMPFHFSNAVVWLSFFLFLVPIVFLFLGSIIGGTGAAGFCRWFGLSTLFGGLIPLGMSLFVEHITKWAIRFAPYSYSDEWSSEIGHLILEKIGWIPLQIVDQIFSPVACVAGVVCIIGVFFFAISFPLGKNR